MRRLVVLVMALPFAWAAMQIVAAPLPGAAVGATPAWADDGGSGGHHDGHEERSDRDRSRDDGGRDDSEQGSGGSERRSNDLSNSGGGDGRFGADEPAGRSSGGSGSVNGGVAALPGSRTKTATAPAPPAEGRTDPALALTAFAAPKQLDELPFPVAGSVALPIRLARWVGYASAAGLLSVALLFVAGFWAKRRILRR